MKKMLVISLLAAGFMGCTHKPTTSPNASVPPAHDFDAVNYKPNYEGVYWTESELREPSNAAGVKCGERIKAAGCLVSNNDMDRIDKGARDCKQFRSSDGRTMEVFLMKKSGTIVTVQTKPVFGGGQCARGKYSLGADILEIKGLAGRIIARAVSKPGSSPIFFIGRNGAFYELLNNSGRSYYNVTDIKGVDKNGQSSNQHLTISFSGATPQTFSADQLDAKINGYGQARAINFINYSTERSLFRDEDVQ